MTTPKCPRRHRSPGRGPGLRWRRCTGTERGRGRPSTSRRRAAGTARPELCASRTSSTWAAPLPPGRRFSAARDFPGRSDVDDKAIFFELEAEDASLVESEEGSEYSGRAHASWDGFGWCRDPKATPSPATHFFTPANPLPSRPPLAAPSNSFFVRLLNGQESPKRPGALDQPMCRCRPLAEGTDIGSIPLAALDLELGFDGGQLVSRHR